MKPGPKEAQRRALRSKSRRKAKKRMSDTAATTLPAAKAKAAHASRHAATLAPKGECAFCDARRETARASMAKRRKSAASPESA